MASNRAVPRPPGVVKFGILNKNRSVGYERNTYNIYIIQKKQVNYYAIKYWRFQQPDNDFVNLCFLLFSNFNFQ